MATPDKIRNIIFIGQSGAGKTSLFDAILFDTKMTSRWGKVSEGTSNSDILPEEIEKKQSITAALGFANYNDYKINMIDTPGYPDFIGEVIGGLRAADAAVFVISAADGVQFTHKNLLKYVNKQGLSKVAFINKMDRDQAKYDDVFDQVKRLFKTGVMPVTIPIGSGPSFSGVVNILTSKAYIYKDDKGTVEITDVPAELEDQTAKFHTAMIEAVAETDDKLLEKYFESGSLSDEELHKGMAAGFASGKITAVLCGSAEKNIGLVAFLDVIAEALPAPGVRELKAADGSAAPNGPSASKYALCWKLVSERNVGDMNFIRIFGGTLASGDTVYNLTKSDSERIGTIFSLIGKEHKEIKELCAGDIGVFVKLKSVHIGDTLAAEKSAHPLAKTEYPTPILDVAFEAQNPKDQEKMSAGIRKLMDEDPTIRMTVDAELHQTVIHTMGEQQIVNMVKNLEHKFGVLVNQIEPRIPYRETIKRKAEAQGRHKKQSGGAGQFGDCWVRFEPLTDAEKTEPNQSFLFINDIFGGAIPKNFVPAIEKGIVESMARGFLAAYPMINVKATVYDGSYHEVDSKDIAFQIAGQLAYKNAMPNCSPIILEPIVKISITVPKDYMGDVMSDISGRRGHVLGQDADDDLIIIHALVPQGELYKYANDLRSFTQGSGYFEIKFDHYQEVPPDISKKIVEASAKYKKEEEQHG